jgi:hypothetical protein
MNETDADSDEQLIQRWQAAHILRQEFPGLDASVAASAIWEAFSDGRETCSRGELVAILKRRAKEAK